MRILDTTDPPRHSKNTSETAGNLPLLGIAQGVEEKLPDPGRERHRGSPPAMACAARHEERSQQPRKQVRTPTPPSISPAAINRFGARGIRVTAVGELGFATQKPKFGKDHRLGDL